ncbi:hypothetical protein DAEQUDRAFT_731924 [Daedalea quercina L-15889]|uniref:Uncharacterized protein n=1 Tax=Daedalea quercina L-15889 TaxID=1314783 RepID=A0A165LX12_9APHY|nr:hypothetical protein DAEQUDRAFT_731924 [Daedalea quercina L-15889]
MAGVPPEGQCGHPDCGRARRSRQTGGERASDKNATRTATSLAKSRGEKLAYHHLAETLDAMEGFARDFEAMTRSENWYERCKY